MRYGETWPTGQQSGGPAVTTPAARVTTPRPERVLRYSRQQLTIAVRALMGLGVLEPADPASGAWWRVNPQWRAGQNWCCPICECWFERPGLDHEPCWTDVDATRALNATPEPPCPDCGARPGRSCYGDCPRYWEGEL